MGGGGGVIFKWGGVPYGGISFGGGCFVKNCKMWGGGSTGKPDDGR